MEKLEVKADVSIDDAGTVTGIAWPFGKPDSIGDLIEPTAFKFAPEIPMLVEHDGGQVVGVWKSYAVTDKGLEVKGRLFVEGSEPARLARQHLKARSMSGLSIGYMNNGFKARPEGGRVLTDITVAEISLCRRPIHPNAGIIEVKSAVDGAAPDIFNKEFSNMDHEQIEAPVVETKSENPIDPKAFEAMKARLDKLEAKANRPQPSNNNHPRAMNDNGDLERKAFTDYVRTGRIEEKALTVGTAANGGYLAPEAMGSELIKLLREYSPIRQYARVVNVSAPEIKYPRRKTSTGAVWVSEIEDRTETGMTFEQISLTPHELATYIDISNQLLEDNAYNLEGELLADFAETFGIAEGRAFVHGTGDGQPKGILTASDIKEVTTGNADAFPTENPADVLIGMYHSIATPHANNGVWLMNRQTLGTVRQWKDGNGRYLVLDPITAGGASTLLGRPIVEVPDMDDIEADATPILFGDLAGYRIVDRIGFETLRDPYSIKIKGQTRFHAWKRVGADVTHPDRFIKLKIAA